MEVLPVPLVPFVLVNVFVSTINLQVDPEDMPTAEVPILYIPLEGAVVEEGIKVDAVTEPVAEIVVVFIVPELDESTPLELIVKAFVEFVANAKVFAADRYIPFVGTVELVGINAADVSVPVVVELPDESSENLIAEFVANANVFAADRYMPLLGAVEPVGINAEAVLVDVLDAAPVLVIVVPLIVAPLIVPVLVMFPELIVLATVKAPELLT